MTQFKMSRLNLNSIRNSLRSTISSSSTISANQLRFQLQRSIPISIPISTRNFSASAPSTSVPPSPQQQKEEEIRRTHFGFKDVREEEKESMVESVFSSVSSSYDLMNDAMSLGIHRLWKDHFVKTLDPRGGIQCLDVAGGTGDIALRILDHARINHGDRSTKVTILDINPSMLIAGQKRLRKSMYFNTPQEVKFQLGNAEHLDQIMKIPEKKKPSERFLASTSGEELEELKSLPIESNSLDLYTIAFGIRNCTHIDEVLKEAHRVLKPGGVFACLEFGKVGVPVLKDLYRAYSFTFIPLLGQLLASDRESYQYLIESIERFPTQPQFSRMMKSAGFTLSGTSEARLAGLPDLAGSSKDGNLALIGGKADEIIRDLAKKSGVRLPGQGFVGQEREVKEFDEDVKGSWEDLSFGIASMWTGIKL